MRPCSASISDSNSRRKRRFTPTAFYRPLLLTEILLGGLLLVVLIAFVYLSWRNLERVQSIRQAIGEVSRLEELKLQLQKALDHPRQTDLAALQGLLAQTPTAEEAQALVAQNRLPEAYEQLKALLERQTTSANQLLTKVVTDIQLELESGVAATFALVVLLALGGLLARHWLLAPLARMNELLLRLAEGHFEPISPTTAAPPWDALIANYNYMVKRLRELEAAHQARARSLEDHVRAATRALLSQSQDLARAERLAALGELAATVAHELRNPLAGIRMALHNLRAECTDPALQRRFDLIIAELERLNHHLNQLLDQARHQPEPICQVELDRIIGETLMLLRYQIPDSIHLHPPQTTGLSVPLPEMGLRQALINLILNAAQALGSNPGNIWIRVRQEQNCLVLEVADDGPGLPESLLSGGIRPFTSSRDGGTGLGLVMVKRFVASLDGRIRLGQNSPQGALITLEIPCQTPS